MMNFLKEKIFHPFLFAAFPVIFLYAENANMVSAGQVWPPLAIVLLLAVIVFAFSWLMLRNWYKAGLITSVLIVIFFLYNPLFSALTNLFTSKNYIEFRHRQFIPLLLLFLTFFYFGLKRTQSNFYSLTGIINFTAIILIVPSVAKIVIHTFQPETKLNSITFHAKSTPDSPDIYYFIMDEYARQDALKTQCNFDNSPFINSLEQRGFYIAKKSTSNYPVSEFSIPATLNLNYLPDLFEDDISLAWKNISTKKLVSNSVLRQILQTNGYQFISFGSGIGYTEAEDADYYFKHNFYASEFDYKILNSTPIIYLFKGLFTKDIFTSHRKTILFPFEKMNEVIMIPQKKFVQIHILSPHMPYVFDRNGNPVNPDDPKFAIDLEARKNISGEKGYVEQVIFLNKKLLQAIDKIKQKSTRNYVIIIQGDHGNRTGIDFNRIENPNHPAIYANLSAFFFPDNDSTGLYQDISNVNTFRVVLNKYFNTHIPLLEDKNFHYLGDKPIKFVDVTNMVKQPILPISQ